MSCARFSPTALLFVFRDHMENGEEASAAEQLVLQEFLDWATPFFLRIEEALNKAPT